MGLACVVAGSAAGASGHRQCVSGDVKLSLTPPVVPMTGENADLIELTNRSSRSCVLDGYPRVDLSDNGKRLAFMYLDGGGSYVTKRKPQRVTLGPGRRAYFLVAKYRCDGGILYPATSIRVLLPGTNGAFTLSLTEPSGGRLDYCKRYPGDQRVDPGNRAVVSPVEGAAMSTSSLR
jgi:Protein of unknown function (DUF4232)